MSPALPCAISFPYPVCLDPCDETDKKTWAGPAYNCQQLNQGDIILKVDDEEVRVLLSTNASFQSACREQCMMDFACPFVERE